MSMKRERYSGKGSDDNLRAYRLKRERFRMIRRIVTFSLALSFVVVLLIIILNFGFVVREIHVEGLTDYTAEQIINNSGITVGENIFTVSEVDAEARLKKEFPYIKTVKVEKAYPSKLVLRITEEYTTYYYEMEGEFFLFNHSLRLMDKFDSLTALKAVREDSIQVNMPLPKSSVVPHYITFSAESEYVSEVIRALSESKLGIYVSAIDLRDKFLIRMECGRAVSVELGDDNNLKGKFSILLRLLGENGDKMVGTVDLTHYPQCFYNLNEEYE
ncbi:MAG: FtsQ-type POTRA domain-containing protein [Clostridia bacterium]|nr:FtsQ-type POTRA domain-containing protein [Clostridia bacterium]